VSVGILNRRMLKSALLHMLNTGIKGIERQRNDVLHILTELSDAHLALHIHVTEESLTMAINERASRS